MPDLHALLDREETALARLLGTVLGEVAAEFSADLADADQIVAARFSVASIARMWSERIHRLVRRLLSTAETAAHTAAAGVDAEADLGDTWSDLPGRWEDGERLPPGIGRYVARTETLLRAVGERLSSVALAELAAGLDAGEDVPQLQERLHRVFSRGGAQLGPARRARIARTEAARAWNMATLAAGQALTGPDRPLVKQWQTMRDTRVRDSHEAVDGQLRLLDEPFTVAGVPMAAPGDPTAPPELVIECRCVLKLATATRASAFGIQASAGDEPSNVSEETPVDPSVTAAADGSHRQGGMIALMPTAEDAARLALDGGEPVEELHLTLAFLGDNGADWTEEQRAELVGLVQARAAELGPITARAFGVNHWNPASDSPSWVWAVGDDREAPAGAPALTDAHAAAIDALESTGDRPELPVQHSPWSPHVCAVYDAGDWPLPMMEERVGPVTFDRIRLAFAGDYTDVPLGAPADAAPPGEEVSAAGVQTRGWTTPDGTALVYENEQTGDGRVFKAGSLFWEDGPWPLQYADEMLSGHDGAELAGAIQTMDRTGDSVGGTGVIYTNRPAGADAVQLLEEGAPLGVSVDLDDVDVEFVERPGLQPDPETMIDLEDPEEEYALAASARLASASFLRLPDGAWMISARASGSWTASGAAMTRAHHAVQLVTGPGGTISGDALRAAFGGTGVLTRPTGEPITASDVELMQIPIQENRARTAAAGDPDDPNGTVVHAERSGDFLVRVTRGRVRGATLVSMPAYNRARIVLDPAGGAQPEPAVTASAVGDTGLPVDTDPGTRWDGGEAQKRILARATAEDGTVDPDKLSAAYLWRNDDADPATESAYKLPFADVIDGELRIIPAGVYAVAGVLQGSMGGVDLPSADVDAVKGRVEELYGKIAKALDDPSIVAPWVKDATASAATAEEDRARVVTYVRGCPVPVGARETARHLGLSMRTAQRYLADAVKAGSLVRLARGLYVGASLRTEGLDAVASWEAEEDALTASAWSALRDAPPMPAAWFREPTAAELPPGSGGVHTAGGRIWGWVARAGEPHAGFPGKKITIESLGALDLTHFLRAKFKTDDGGFIKAGAFTMNVGHHRDGAECETAACQFDSTRTVAGVVTVGINAGGMWFSGAAAPWLSDWDRTVFAACQPSYHMSPVRQDGRRELRAVLSVPVPGHSSPLLASFTERSNLALAAAAVQAADTAADMSGHTIPIPADVSAIVTMVAEDIGLDLRGHRPDNLSGNRADTVSAVSVEDVADIVAAAMSAPGFMDELAAAIDRRAAARAEIAELSAALNLDPQLITAGTAGTTKGA